MNQKNIGTLIAIGSVLLPTDSNAGTDINGDGYRRSTNGRPQSCVLFAVTGNATGTPSAQSHVFVLQHSDDDGAGDPDAWVDYADENGAEKIITITADDTKAELDVTLSNAKDHVRLIYDASRSSFTTGTTPKNILAGGIVFGGFMELPQ